MRTVSRNSVGLSVQVRFIDGGPNLVEVRSTDGNLKEALVRVGKVSAVGQAPDIRDFLIHVDETTPSFVYGISSIDGADIVTAAAFDVRNEFGRGKLQDHEYVINEDPVDGIGTRLRFRAISLITNASILISTRFGDGPWNKQALTISDSEVIQDLPVAFFPEGEEYRIEGVFGSFLKF